MKRTGFGLQAVPFLGGWLLLCGSNQLPLIDDQTTRGFSRNCPKMCALGCCCPKRRT